MKEKNCVVTGGNSGIGFETALALARKKRMSLFCQETAKRQSWR
jgi:NAD(P)-dependent dehydrogenase (short-subunit alcohol dehydrogenase family)